MNKSLIRSYYKVTKPGIIYGNDLATLAGFLLAARQHINFFLLFAVLLGISLVIASACVFNNFIDRKIDAKMERTKKRELVIQAISPKNAIIYGTILGLVGFLILFLYTNLLTVILGIIGLFFYIVIYAIAKRNTIHGTIVGSISGSIPLVVGYCAVANRFDIGAILLFIILALWQMPHFYSLAIYRADEYSSAGIPVLPVKLGVKVTKGNIFAYILVFTIVCTSLTYFKYTGYTYLFVMLGVSTIWLIKSIQGFKTLDDKLWGKSMFRFSLVVLLVFCAIISLNGIIQLS